LYYLAGALAQNVIENQLDRGKRRAMEQQIAQLKDHFIICGFGRVGQQTCYELAQENCRFLVIDSDDERLERIQAAGYLCVQGDGEMLVNPKADVVLQDGDIIIALGTRTDLERVGGNGTIAQDRKR